MLASFSVPQNSFGQFTIKRSTFTRIGESSTGGSYVLKSTLGTTGGSAPLTGGSFSLTSSPWSVVLLESPGAPKLGIVGVPGGVRITWSSPATGWVLQQNTNNVHSVNWSNVTATIQDDGTTKTLVVSPPTGNRFYRLFKP